MFLRLVSLLFFVLPFLTNSVPAYAIQTSWQHTDQADVRLVVGGYSDDAILHLGVEFRLQDGWNIYWKNPGEAGFPVTFSLSSPKQSNLNVYWPTPTRKTESFQSLSLTGFVYKHQVLFPLTITGLNPSQSHPLTLQVDYGICREICIPAHADFTLPIPEHLHDAGDLAILTDAYANVPSANTDDLPLHIDANTLSLVTPTDDQSYLYARVLHNTPPSAIDAFIDGNEHLTAYHLCTDPNPNAGYTNLFIPLVFFDKNVTDISDSFHLIVTDHTHSIASSVTLANLPTFTLQDWLASGHINSTCLTKNSNASPAISTATSNTALHAQRLAETFSSSSALWLILLFALFGGFILNLMPCVLPVLSIKLFSILHAHHNTSHRIRLSFFITGLGILFSFFALASTLILLKIVGLQVGWGFHFQQPYFVIFLILLVILFACGMVGILPIRTLNASADRIDHSRHPILHHFLTGCFATLLATPCTAPFLGTAAGFAVTQSAPTLLLIFSVIGLGMALPYWLFALFPRTVSLLPKSGQWMNYVKYGMGLLLFLTALWLMWILSFQLGRVTALCIFLASFAFIAALYLNVTTKRTIIFTYIAVIFLVTIFTSSSTIKPSVDDSWTPFSTEELYTQVNQGKIVFLDLTANWCLTCKFNKLTTLDSTKTQRLFQSNQVLTMQGDWTNKNAEISQFLNQHHRAGVPFNAVFCSSHTEGIILPELLTTGAIADAIEQCH